MTASTDVSTTPKIEQVGGDHYASTGLQHWDLCSKHDLPYLLGCATKYVARHRRKNGREDLEKAASYLERYTHARRVGEARFDTSRLVPSDEFVNWAADARLNARDLPVLHVIMCTGQHHVATEMLRQMTELEYPVNPVYDDEVLRPQDEKYTPPTPRAAAEARVRLTNLGRIGTPEDGGHHAVVLPRSVSQFEYDHRIDPEMRVHYAHNPSSCRWELQEGPGVVADDVGADG